MVLMVVEVDGERWGSQRDVVAHQGVAATIGKDVDAPRECTIES